MEVEWFVAVLMFAVGIPFTAFHLYMKKHGVKVDATVTRRSTSDFDQDNPSYSTYVAYTYDGKEYTATITIYCSSRRPAIITTRSKYLAFIGIACMGYGLCTKQVPELFEMEGKKASIRQGIAPNTEKLAQTIEACPVKAISNQE